MTDKDEKKLRSQINKYFKNSNSQESFDSILIDELLFQLELINKAKEEIRSKGQSINVSKDVDKPYYQVNPSIGIYQTAIKSLNSILTKLALTPQERNKIKQLAVKSTDDEFTKPVSIYTQTG
jgi:P27 family predicted phage terminase small subunit